MKRSLFIVILLLLVAPVQAAELGAWTADRAYFYAGAQTGPADLLWIHHSSDDMGDLELTLSAARVEGTEYSRDLMVFPAADPVTGTETYVPMALGSDPRPIDAGLASFRLEGLDPFFTISIQADSMGLGADLGSFQALSLPAARLTNAGIVAGEGPIGEAAEDDFQVVEAASPRVVSRASDVGIDLDLQGDLVVELRGVALRMTDSSGEEQVVEGRRVYRSVDDTGSFDGATQVAEEHFVRLHLDGASLSLRSAHLDGRMEWASSGIDVVPRGMSTFLNTTGSLQGSDGARDLTEEEVSLAGVPSFSLVPDGDHIAVRVDGPAGAFAPDGTFVAAPPESHVPIWAWAALAAAVAVAFVPVARRLRVPHLTDVEAAIEAGKHRRAARMAGRMLRRDPGREGVWVARAVALSRAGRFGTVIEEVEPRLDRTDPSDGVLHYVLGLAYLEAGRTDEGLIKLEEAVRRTPELERDVEQYRPAARAAPGYT